MSGNGEAHRSELGQAAEWLEKITRDPLADAVRGHIEVESVSDAVRRGRYQECHLTVIASAPGGEPTRVTLDVVIDRRHWPHPGQRLPARISASDPSNLDVSWDALRG